MRNWRWNVKLKSLLYDVGNPCSHQITAFQQEARLHFFWPRLIFVDWEYQFAFCQCIINSGAAFLPPAGLTSPSPSIQVWRSAQLRVTSVILSLFVVSASALVAGRHGGAIQLQCTTIHRYLLKYLHRYLHWYLQRLFRHMVPDAQCPQLSQFLMFSLGSNLEIYFV